jgi:hypothetical protein
VAAINRKVFGLATHLTQQHPLGFIMLKAYEDAAFFLTGLYGVILPRVGIAEDGEIVVSWKTDKVVVDLSITGDGTYSFYAEADGEVFTADDKPITEPLPSALLSALTESKL